MKGKLNRRQFTAGLGAAALHTLPGGESRRLKAFPRRPEASATLEAAVRDVAGPGYDSFATFPETLGDWSQTNIADATKVIKDFPPLVHHMHLKDYDGGPRYAGYCPLGMGNVAIPAILDVVEGGGQRPNIMVELDPSAQQPMTPLQPPQTSAACLRKLGYTFRT